MYTFLGFIRRTSSPSKLSVIADFGDARQRARREKGGREGRKRIEEDGTSAGGREEEGGGEHCPQEIERG